jgi:hypothetical protein
MKYAIAAASIAFSVAVSDEARAQTLTECGKSDGYAYYFVGGLVPAGKGGWQKDGIDGGRIILNYVNGDLDLLIKKRHWFNYVRKARWWENNPETDDQRSYCTDCHL